MGRMSMYRTHNLGKRRVVLAAAAGLCFVRAAAYSPPIGVRPADALIVASAGSPTLFAMYLAAWIGVGCYCLAHLGSGHIARPVVAVSTMYVVWGMAWLLPWLMDRDESWWISGCTFTLFAVLLVSLVFLTPRWPDTDRGRE